MKRNSKTLRTLTAVLVVLLVCAGLAFRTGGGTPSAWGLPDVAALCPLGALEAALASKTIVPPFLIAAAIGVLLVVVFGRAFCAWGCPVPLLRRVFGLKNPQEKKAAEIDSPDPVNNGDKAVAEPAETKVPKASKTSPLDIKPAKRGGASDSRNWVLGGIVLSTAVFGFPVFCLICPVGLTFATVIALWRLFQFSETTLSLIVFPAILLIEVLFLRKWCSRFCPLGALLSLLSRANRTFRPLSNASTCLQTSKGESCHKCADVCPEEIDLHDKITSAPMNECTKCRACADVCPMEAITFPFLQKKTDNVPAAKSGVDTATEENRENR